MSIIKVNQVTTVNETDRVTFPTGVSVGIVSATNIVAGVTTSTTLNATTITAGGIISAAGGFAGDGSQLTNINTFAQGQYNPGIGTFSIYDPTTTSAIAFSVGAGIGTLTKYIVHSVHITNTASVDVSVTGLAYAADFSIGTQLPVPAKSSMELLKKPKLLSAGQSIKLNASANSSLKAFITAEKITDTNGDFFGSGVTCTAADTYYDLHVTTGSSMIRSLLISNKNTSYDTKVNVVVTDSSNNILTFLASDLFIPGNSTLELFDTEKFIPNTYKIRISASTASFIDATISGRRTYNLG